MGIGWLLFTCRLPAIRIWWFSTQWRSSQGQDLRLWPLEVKVWMTGLDLPLANFWFLCSFQIVSYLHCRCTLQEYSFYVICIDITFRNIVVSYRRLCSHDATICYMYTAFNCVYTQISRTFTLFSKATRGRDSTGAAPEVLEKTVDPRDLPQKSFQKIHKNPWKSHCIWMAQRISEMERTSLAFNDVLLSLPRTLSLLL